MIFENYFWFLFAFAVVTSVVSAAVGFLGGTILLTVMAQFIAPPVLIPLHGLAQLWSNLVRFFLLRRHIYWPIVRPYSMGAVLGGACGVFLVSNMPERLFSLVLGVFTLAMTLLPKEKWRVFASNVARITSFSSGPRTRFINKWTLVGFVASFLGLVVGAVGVLVGSFFLLERTLEKKEIIATQAVCQAMAHVLKIAVYLYLGFQMGPWVLLIGGLIVSGWVGSFLGTRVLDAIPGDVFLRTFKWLIVILSLRLIWQGIA